MLAYQKGKKESFRLEGTPVGHLHQPSHQHSVNRPCSDRIAQGFDENYLEKSQEQRLQGLSYQPVAVSNCLTMKNVFLISSLLFHFMTTISFATIASQMLHSAVPRKIIKPGSNLLYRDTTPTSLLSISTTPFLVSFLIPYLHTPSVACLLSVHPWLLQIIYQVFST